MDELSRKKALTATPVALVFCELTSLLISKSWLNAPVALVLSALYALMVSFWENRFNYSVVEATLSAAVFAVLFCLLEYLLFH